MARIGRRSPVPAKASRFDAEFDVVIAGSGAADASGFANIGFTSMGLAIWA